ncbi:MAG: hypothetical protein HXO52_00780 [Prevotella sp.]|jgi:hypothetical protein|uniref:Uncharacterized protein n=1 Tax=Prevotella vespertina TaxID=2608404 RepID=A0A7C9LCU1_9BACT|nr:MULTISPECIES: hypothetical protein [Prevotella]EID34050.1 hypothetical protein HMPREF9969_0413 [Prevotella sp. oral taxon 306 str. F0472]MBF1625543.1 hypothetical protein [Prevotella sp.]MBF1627773.1 hypothetical protein [Prevotella sp.]MBF1631406.1 hypothetical protein [Prevotella sp.]MBF1642567.1 hypothetical protein [Prevotella sp.]
MKKIFLALMCLFPLVLFGQGTELSTAPKCWTVPAVFTADEEVTFYYDMTDVGFQEGVDLYLWAWQPTEPDAGHGGNSSDFAKLEYVGNNIYKKTMIPTQYFHCDVSKFEDAEWPGFWQRLKTKDGSLWSGVFAAPDSRLEFANFKKSGAGITFFSGKKSTGLTEKFTLDEPLTVLFNPDVYKLGDKTLTELAKDADFVQFGVHSALNDWTVQQTLDVWRPAVLKKAGLKKLSNGLYAWNVGIPSEYYAYNPQDAGQADKPTILADPDQKASFQLENMNYIIIKVIKDANGANQWGVNSGDQKQKAGSAAPYPDPMFSYFPTRVSAKDILTLTREYNERTSGDLKYTIVAGSKTLTGTMSGVRDKREVTLDLNKELEGVKASELKLTIKEQHDRVVVESTIPLVVAD